MDKYCYSCGLPLAQTENSEGQGNYCRYCTDEKGNLLPREAVKKGIAAWLEKFSPEKENVDFMKRAEFYLKAMPAWAEE